MARTASEPCVVSGQQCTAPAGYISGDGGLSNGKGHARYTCYRCGEPVCTKCSRMTNLKEYDRKHRFCENCLEELA